MFKKYHFSVAQQVIYALGGSLQVWAERGAKRRDQQRAVELEMAYERAQHEHERHSAGTGEPTESAVYVAPSAL